MDSPLDVRKRTKTSKPDPASGIMAGSVHFLVLVAWLTFQSNGVSAETVRIAVASNFHPTLTKLVQAVPKEPDTEYVLISGSTGVLYSQISNGAPFDILMAADKVRPALLDTQGLIEAGSRKTYAVGRLALWAPRPTFPVNEVFLQNFQGNLAIANPEIAPYGVAAKELLSPLDLSKIRLIKGNNVGQAFHFVQTENAQAGLVALSQVLHSRISKKFFWPVDQGLYKPIEQQMVTMNQSPGTIEFTAFLTTDAAMRIISNDGYQLPGPREN